MVQIAVARSAVKIMHVDPAQPAESRSAADRRETRARPERSPKDMTISLLVLLIPIALLLAFYRVVLGGDEPTRVDPTPVIAQARAVNAFPVSEPVGLSSGWRPVRAAFQQADGGRMLRIGYLSPQDRGVQLLQGDVPAERLLPAELTSSSRPQGAIDVVGRSWQRYTARAGELALVLLEPDRTVIVVGAAAEAELLDLAASLS